MFTDRDQPGNRTSAIGDDDVALTRDVEPSAELGAQRADADLDRIVTGSMCPLRHAESVHAGEMRPQRPGQRAFTELL